MFPHHSKLIPHNIENRQFQFFSWYELKRPPDIISRNAELPERHAFLTNKMPLSSFNCAFRSKLNCPSNVVLDVRTGPLDPMDLFETFKEEILMNRTFCIYNLLQRCGKCSRLITLQ